MFRYKNIIPILIISVSLLLAVNNQSNILYGDALGYYVYLPASIIHHKLDKVDDLADDENIPTEIRSGISKFKKSYSTNESGNSIIQYTYGLSAMQAPGFLAVYVWDKLRGKSPTGFELRYQNALVFLNIFYLLIGLLFCYRSLSIFFSKVNSAITLGIGLLGTNLFWFGFLQSGMAHIPQFMLISIVLYLSIKLKDCWSNKIIFRVALLMGLITIIRPVDIIYGLIPIVFIIEGILKNQEYKSELINGLPVKLIGAMILFLIPIIPQLLYWKMMTGSFLYDSYSNYHFHWTDPEIIKGLLGAKNGWFMYTPVMLLATIGLVCKSIPRSIKIMTFIILPIHIYISYAWYNYNYINGFGSRPMIHIYPLVLFGMVGLLSIKNRILHSLCIILLITASLVSMKFTYSQSKGMLFSDESTLAFNKNTFFKTSLDYYDLFYLNSPWNQAELSNNKDCITIGNINYNEIVNAELNSDSISNKNFTTLNSNEKYPTGSIAHNIQDQEKKEYSALKSTIEMNFQDYRFMPHNHHKLIVEVNRDGEQVFWDCISINDKINKQKISSSNIEIRKTYVDTWDSIDYFFPMDKLQTGDMVKVYVWNPNNRSADFKNLSVSLCK